MFKRTKRYFRRRFIRHYRRKRWQLFLDISLSTVILILAVSTFILTFYKPSPSFPNFIPPIDKPPLSGNDFELIEEDPLSIEISLENTRYQGQDTIPIKLILKNKSNWTISDLNLDLDSLRNNFKLNFDPNLLKVGTLKAQAELSLDLDLATERLNPQDRTLSLVFNYQYKFAQQRFADKINLEPIYIQAEASDLNAQVRVYYNSPQGDQLGSGPLPPISGLPTNFWVFLNLEAKTQLSGAVFSAKLAPNVSFTNNFSLLAGNLSFNPDSRQIIWQVGNLSPEQGSNQANLELQLIPSDAQIGSLVNLLENIRIQALDPLTNVQLSRDLYNTNTSLDYDLINQGQGVVQGINDIFDYPQEGDIYDFYDEDGDN